MSWNVLIGGVSIGQQPGYIRDIDIRHNTLLGSIDFGCVVGDPNSKNFIVRDNILIPDNFFAYASINCKFLTTPWICHRKPRRWARKAALTTT